MNSAALLDTERHRRELLSHCYRFFGCYREAEDAVQEVMLRAWQHRDRFDGRSSLRTWLYRIATNVCLDMQGAPQRRALPAALNGPGEVPADPSLLRTRPPEQWVGPLADSVLRTATDPADAAVANDSIRLAFVAALQLLPPRQRAVLLLRDVLAFSAQETAQVLEMTVPAANSALARARRTLAEESPGAGPVAADRAGDAELLADYVAAFEAYDVDALVALLAADAEFSMPPFELWLRGVNDIERWWRGPGQVCRGSRVIATSANGQPAMAAYHPVDDRRWEPFALHVLEARDGQIHGLTHFMGPDVFAEFGLPAALAASGEEVSR